MINVKAGRKAAVHTERRARSAAALAVHLDLLGPPPVAVDWRPAVRQQLGSADWGMFGNDIYGCCVWADEAHQDMLRTANAGKLIVPPRARVLANYSAVTGFQAGPPPVHDEGTDENDALAWLRAQGVLDDYASIDFRNLDHIRWAITMFGAVRLGILVSEGYEDLFSRNQPWATDLRGNEGHDVCLVAYDQNWLYACTWGRDDQAIAPSLLTDSGFCDEAHAELAFDWVRTVGGSPAYGLDLATLTTDLGSVGHEDAARLSAPLYDRGALEAAKHGEARSPHWRTVRNEGLLLEPECIATGLTTATGAKLERHHCDPFHFCKRVGRNSFELWQGNLVTLCREPIDAHLYLGHDDNFEESDRDPHEASRIWHGKSEAEIRDDPTWVERKTKAYPVLKDWSRDDLIAFRRLLDAKMPIGGPEYEAINKRFGVVDVPFDEWLATLPPA